MEVSCQGHALGALSPGKEHDTRLIRGQVGPGAVWTFEKRETPLVPDGNRVLEHPAHSPVCPGCHTLQIVVQKCVSASKHTTSASDQALTKTRVCLVPAADPWCQDNIAHHTSSVSTKMYGNLMWKLTALNSAHNSGYWLHTLILSFVYL
jgi:hypothetical protein